MSDPVRIIVTDERGAFFERALATMDALDHMGYKPVIDTYDAEILFGGIPVNNHAPYDCAKRQEIELGGINIFLNGHRIIPDPKKINICIQTEQLHFAGYDKFAAQQKDWTLILDLFRIQARGNNWRYFPMGYSPHFDFRREVERDGKLYFFGNMTPHREWLAREFGMFCNSAYGYARDWNIKASRAVAYMHYCPAVKFMVAPHRALLALCKERCLLYEETVRGCGIYDDMCLYFSEKSLPGLLKRFSREKMDAHAASIRQNLIANHRFEDHFREAMRGVL